MQIARLCPECNARMQRGIMRELGDIKAWICYKCQKLFRDDNMEEIEGK